VIYQANRLTDEERWARLGANFILHAADIIFFAEGIRRELGDLKHRLRDGAAADGPRINI
jgi:hypothetical protein